MKPLFALLFLAASSPAIAAPAPHAKPAFRINSLIQKHFPTAQIAQDNGTLVAKYNTMTFTLHNRSKSGAINQEPYQAEGPQADGFILSISAQSGKYEGQAMVPQTLQRPYWQTYIDRPPTADGHSHHVINFSYGVRLDKDFKQALFREFAKLSPPALGPTKPKRKVTPKAFVPKLNSIQWQENSRRSTRTLKLHDDGTFDMNYVYRTAEVGQDEKLTIKESIKENHSGTWRMLSTDHSLLALYSDRRVTPEGIRLYRLPSEDPQWRFQSVALRHKSFDRYDQPSEWLEVSPGWHAVLRDLSRHHAEENALHPLGLNGPLSMRFDVPNDIVNKLAKALPKGWSLQGFENVLLISRHIPVVLKYSMINAPMRSFEGSAAEVAVEKWNRSYEQRYQIFLRFGEKLSEQDYEIMSKANKETQHEITTIRDKLRSKRIPHKFDSYLPKQPEHVRMVAAFEKLQASLEELPNYYTNQYSIWLNTTDDRFASTEVAEECLSVKEKLQSLLQPYEKQTK